MPGNYIPPSSGGGGGGGAVDSVNGQTGTVVLTASQVGAEATGVAAALVDDLSGVTSASTARTNLGLGTAATTAATAYATAAQGTKADTAVQPTSLASASPLSKITARNTFY